MGGTIVTNTVIPPAITEFYDRNLLENARPALMYDRWGQVRTMKQAHGDQIKFRRANILAVATTPLLEGITPSGSSFGYADVTAIMKQYGDFVIHSDRIETEQVDTVVTDITTEQGFQAGTTVDDLRRDVLVAGTNVQYANGSARTDVNTIIAKGDFQTAVRFLKNQNAKPFTALVKPGEGTATEAVPTSFWGVCHPDITPTIQGMTGFIDVKDYPDSKQSVMHEIGTIDQVRIVETTQGKIFAGGGASGGSNVKETTNADVYATLIFGRNAYGLIPFEGEAGIQSIIKPIGSSGSADPLDQRGTVGWKLKTTTKILNDAFMIRIESAATDVL